MISPSSCQKLFCNILILVVQCVVEDGKSEHRVCIFRNVVLWEGQLLYVGNGEPVHVLVRKSRVRVIKASLCISLACWCFKVIDRRTMNWVCLNGFAWICR